MTPSTPHDDSSLLSRRRFAALSGGAAATALAGCADDTGEEPADTDDDHDHDHDHDQEFTVAATGPALWDFTRHIVGDHMEVFDIIPTGEHSEEYEPTTGDLQAAEEADAFVYMRSWVGWMDDFAAEHEAGDTVEVIEASAGIEFFDSPAEDGDEHWWMDPVECQTGVTNIADGLAELDPDHADEYEANAEEYNDELDELHEEFEALAERATLDQIVLGTHNSFGWWARRYDITVTAPIGLDPDTQPAAGEIEEIQETIDEFGLNHVLYDIGEPVDLAQSIADDTGAEVLPISPIETQIDGSPPVNGIEMSPDWTYFDHFREINFPSMEIALQAE